MRTRIALVLAVLLVASWATELLGQSMPEDKKATIVFDLQMARLKESKLGQMGAQNTPPLPPDAPFTQDTVDSITRIFGQASTPPMDMGELTPDQPLPFEMFARVVFDDEAAASEMWDAFKADAKSVERGGKTFYRTDDMPPNMSAQMVKSTVIEVGTDFYLDQSSRRLFTDNLAKTWKSALATEQALRIAVDLMPMQEHVKMAQEAIKAQTAGQDAVIRATANGFAERMDNIDSLRMGVDFASKNLMTLIANGKDSSQAEDFGEAFDAILGMGKIGLGAQMGMLESADTNGNITSVVKAFTKSMKAEVDGTEVSWTVPRSNKLEAAVEDIPQLMGAMMGGFGPPGGGPPGGGGFGPPGGGPPGGGFGPPPGGGGNVSAGGAGSATKAGSGTKPAGSGGK